MTNNKTQKQQPTQSPSKPAEKSGNTGSAALTGDFSRSHNNITVKNSSPPPPNPSRGGGQKDDQ